MAGEVAVGRLGAAGAAAADAEGGAPDAGAAAVAVPARVFPLVAVCAQLTAVAATATVPAMAAPQA